MGQSPYTWAVCERCKEYKGDCYMVAYSVPPRLTPPPMETLIGDGYMKEVPAPIEWEDVHVPAVMMCSDCREKKLQTV